MNLVKLFIILLAIPLANAEALYCRVVGVTDGDTIKCLTTQKKQLKIRLYQIDAPEKKQAFGAKSKQALSDLVYKKNVLIETHKKDKYRRTLGTIYLNNSDINLQMIKHGMAWYYPFSKKNNTYKKAEQTARNNNIGLWAAPHISPWDFRKQKRNKK